ncbi:TetR/AcrR family transcriptional regulator [Streptomyces sp. CA-210063]|uniref:TetR/AcrR family transcriptional regulator n=1 Tax=Streptomyces sp. CA-210063 TaxID=2801029 RepID=UPI00214B45AA|nr:TetR/AcrR family transcriptional regulator [Streptomyces sp. CA-210063]UUU28469.1 TetR/AcrR family transcriptional regulator [Streptomyces sp. CA-210063]
MSATPLVNESWERFRDTQRAGIVAAIIELVNEQDSVITIAQIADRAGVSRPTFYKYFPTLGAAMLHVHRQVIDTIAEHGRQSPAEEDLDGRTQVLQRMATFASLASVRPDLIRFSSYFDYTFRRHGLTDDELRALHEREAFLMEIARESFRKGQQDGSIRPELDIPQTVEVIGESILGLAQRALVTADGPSAREIDIEQHLAMALDAWRAYLTPQNGT